MTATTLPAQPERTADAFVGRIFEASVGMMDVISVYMGDQLGLYRALRDGGPATPAELATRAGIDERYAREWLEQQAATGILDVDDVGAAASNRRFSLPDAYAEPLIDRDSPYSVAPFARSLVGAAKVLPQLLEAYRTGGGVEWNAYGSDMVEAQGDFNRPWLLGSFATDHLPQLPGIHDRLTADPPARVADVACGVGWAAIATAKAYPKVRVDGFDIDPKSIDLANQNARGAGVADRVTFEARDVAEADAGAYDFAVIIEALHDMTQPVGVLSSIRRMLKPDGTLLIADEKTEDAFTAPASETERLYYGYSITTCLPAAMTERPTEATGTVMRASNLERLGLAAGFKSVERLDQPELDMLRYYRLTP